MGLRFGISEAMSVQRHSFSEVEQIKDFSRLAQRLFAVSFPLGVSFPPVQCVAGRDGHAQVAGSGIGVTIVAKNRGCNSQKRL
jgi:hypothetical protein